MKPEYENIQPCTVGYHICQEKAIWAFFGDPKSTCLGITDSALVAWAIQFYGVNFIILMKNRTAMRIGASA